MPRAKSIKSRSLLLWLLASTALSFPAGAATLSGKTVKVTTSASASGEEGNRALMTPSDVFQGDVITTNRSGEAQIKFLDDTRFAVGPGSSVTIDQFVYNPDRTASAVGISALKGTFRFIGGVSSHDAYVIRTPTATIGIRGTAVDFAVGPNGETTVLWQEGTGWICVVPIGSRQPEPTDCTDVTLGDMFVAPPGGGLIPVTREQRAGVIQQSLLYSSTQQSLVPEFQLAQLGNRPPPAPLPRFSPPGSPYQ